MKKLCFAFAVAAIVFSIFTGCSGSGSSSSKGKTASASNEIDVLKIGVAALPNTGDPMLNVGNTGIRVFFNVFETLLLADQNDNLSIKPMLAESWKRIDDYTIEFKLMKGVKFHDGTELKAKDVKFSLDRLKEKIPSIDLAASLMSIVKETQIIDDYTVRVVTSAVDPILADRLASSWGAWMLPEEYTKRVGNDAFALNPIGTGPYKLTVFSPQKVVLERFDDYWGEKPAAKRIEYILYSETSSRITALMTGEVDIITQIPPDQIRTVENDPNLSVISTVISNMHVLIFNTDAGPMKDVKFRKALSLGIDRQLLIDTLWSGKAVLPRGHQYPEFRDLYFSDYPAAEYNPELAKKLIAESGYKGEVIDYELQSGYYTFGNEAAEAITDMWKAIGVNAKISFRDKKQYLFVSNWSNTMRFPDPLGGLWTLWGPGSTPHRTTWKDMPANFIKTGTELGEVIDPARRKVLARELMTIWDEEVPGTVLYYPFESWGMRKGLDWKPYPSQTMDFRANNFKVTK